jgi:anti-sigma-K factor RskA
MEKNLKERWNGKTPKFWKRVQRWAIITGAVAGAIIAAPVTLPAVVITTATYVATVATTAATLSQLTVEDNKIKKDDKEN